MSYFKYLLENTGQTVSSDRRPPCIVLWGHRDNTTSLYWPFPIIKYPTSYHQFPHHGHEACPRNLQKAGFPPRDGLWTAVTADHGTQLKECVRSGVPYSMVPWHFCGSPTSSKSRQTEPRRQRFRGSWSSKHSRTTCNRSSCATSSVHSFHYQPWAQVILFSISVLYGKSNVANILYKSCINICRQFTKKKLLALKANKCTAAKLPKKMKRTETKSTINSNIIKNQQNKSNINHNKREESNKCPKVQKRAENICSLSGYIQTGREYQREGLPPIV